MFISVKYGSLFLEAMHSWNKYFLELYQTSKGQKTKKAEEMD